jgi:hypothetical protein
MNAEIKLTLINGQSVHNNKYVEITNRFWVMINGELIILEKIVIKTGWDRINLI